jgi:hypothetical protein
MVRKQAATSNLFSAPGRGEQDAEWCAVVFGTAEAAPGKDEEDAEKVLVKAHVVAIIVNRYSRRAFPIITTHNKGALQSAQSYLG